MKKVLCLVLVLSMLLSCCCITGFADDDASKAMEDVLIKVKQKVSIPEELEEFEPRVYGDKGEVNYRFGWNDEKGNKTISVATDGEGRITNYYCYDNTLKSTKKLTNLSKSEIICFAETFLKTIAPEAFADQSDSLVYDENTWSVNGTSYSLGFVRRKDGVDVKNNAGFVDIMVYDDVPIVNSAYINFDYDAKFEEVPVDVDGYEEFYRKAFPIEMIYTDEYNGYWRMDEKEENVVILYRHKDDEAGYILASNGEIATEDVTDVLYRGGNGVMMEESMATDTAAYKEAVALTDKELKELAEVDGLISQDDAKEILQKLPYLNIEPEIAVTQFGIRKHDEKYLVSVHMEAEDKHYFSATLDGKSGEVLNLSNSICRTGISADEEKELSEEQRAEAEKKIDEFLSAVAKDKIEGFEEQNVDVNRKWVRKRFDRVANGVRYISDGINVGFDYKTGIITDYTMDYEERVFPDASSTIDEDSAYVAMRQIAPLKKIYIITNGVYKVCYTVSENVMIDATTGEKYESLMYSEPDAEFEYSDISGHWAEEKINKLAEVQIGLSGEKFNPDQPISQYDLLRFFGGGIWYKSYLNLEQDDLYEDLIYQEIISEEEKNADGTVKREDAFRYMIGFIGLSEVAELSDIFKVEYSDGEFITDGKIGYPAILTGMNVICGNGGYVRPQDSITRAEAAVMIYNYLMK